MHNKMKTGITAGQLMLPKFICLFADRADEIYIQFADFGCCNRRQN